MTHAFTPTTPMRIARTQPRATPYAAFDNLGIAWLLLLIGSFSFANSSAAVALSGQLNGANIIRYACVVGAMAMLAPELRSQIKFALNPLWLFVAYIVVCLLSATWGVSPVVSFGKAAELAVAVATVVLAANRGPGRAVEQLFTVTFWFGVSALIVVAFGYFLGLPGFVVRATGVFPQMDAWFISSNNVGYLSALTATIALDRALRRPDVRPLMTAVFALTMITAIGAQGRTGLLCYLVGMVVVLAMHRRSKILLLGGGLAVLLAAVFSGEIMAYLLRGEHEGSLQTLTGRTVVWQAAWQSFMSRPFLGSGFGVGGRYLFLSNLAGSDVQLSSAHNGLMELLTGVGLLGFIPWIAALLWTAANAIRAFIGRTYTTAAAVIPLMIVITAMSSGAGGWFDFMVGYFLCSMALLQRCAPQKARLRRRQR